MSIGRLQASLAQATNEVTVAAANINFDFCLVKYEAPKEYRPLGERLSTKRKQDAEHGKSHATARRLAALFEGLCPDTPNLIKAYGERVSEISKQATDQESRDYSSSVFGAYAGVDGTSIWAAATSSRSAKDGAIHVHLLACMLASMFGDAQATSVWVELVEERRNSIASGWERDEAIPFSIAAAAAQQGITRSQLAEWDSSARAWLQTADSIMVSKQTQLRLILKNVNLSMGTQTTVYPSVIEIWKKTLRTMEWLVSGVPQEVQDGSAILGLAAWHIYPDIHVFGSRNVEVLMKDCLVRPGGILSLGCSPSVTTPASGVTWALSLTQFKFYGQPVLSHGAFRPDPTRLTFKELMMVSLGSILSRWNIPIDRGSTVNAVRIVALLWDSTRKATYLMATPVSAAKQKMEGLRLLSEAAEAHLKDEQSTQPFINLGRNRPQFIPPWTKLGGSTQHVLHSFFGLLQIDALLAGCRDSEARIELLRRMATRAKAHEDYECIIQYLERTDRGDLEGYANYATVFPQVQDSLVQGASQELARKRTAASHSRWLHPKLIETTVVSEIIHENSDYSIYSPDMPPRLRCRRRVPAETDGDVTLECWYGDWDLAAIYVHRRPDLPPLTTPKLTVEDLLWCLEHDALSLDGLLQISDSIVQTLQCLGMANMGAFATIPGPVIQVKILASPLVQATFAKELASHSAVGTSTRQASPSNQTISILSYLVAGHDIPHSKIPGNVVGISSGDSVFVPERLLRDPMASRNPNSFTRILGNLGRPGFVMFFSVDQPMMSPPDTTFWRDAAPHRFDGTAVDLFESTSMHLSFTNWERPLEGISSRGNQDVRILLMESVISIRERGQWIGDVDVLPALRSPIIYILPEQQACSHPSFEPPDLHMTSIECWDELREFPAGNVVVRANGNWLARLATTAYLAQYAERNQGHVTRITLCPRSVCWKCMRDYIQQFSANIYIY